MEYRGSSHSLWCIVLNIILQTKPGYGNDVELSMNTCYNIGDDIVLTAKYNGTGTVSMVMWYFSDALSNLNVRESTCAVLGTPDAAYPTSRMSYGCNSPVFKVTITGVLQSEMGKSLGVDFGLTVGNAAAGIQLKELKQCIDECQTNADNCCDGGGCNCINTDESFSCSCDAGYTGNGVATSDGGTGCTDSKLQSDP